MAETILEALDDSGSAKHAGYEEKEARRLRRMKRLEKAGMKGGIARMKENTEYVAFPLLVFGETEKGEGY